MTETTTSTATQSWTSIGALRVTHVRTEAEGVISIRLEHPDGEALPYAAPGSHLDLQLPSGLIRQYSLCGDSEDASAYTVAVLHEENGRGGSKELHTTPLVGRLMPIKAVRNHFPLEPRPRYMLIAGGIGITPLMSMARQLSKGDIPWELLYLGRSRDRMAFLDELVELCGDRLQVRPDDEFPPLDLASHIGQTPPGTTIYCCGPEGLLGAVEKACATGSANRELRTERFGATSNADRQDTQADRRAFTVRLSRQGIELPVPQERSLLDVVRDVVPDVPFSCEEGYCGTCEAFVLAGIPDHKDDVLSPAERASNRSMMICVSRSLTPRLELDL